MMQITGTITTRSDRAAVLAASVQPDNLRSMTTVAEGDRVVTTITGTQLRSIIASVDDYLMNLAIAEDAARVVPQQNSQK